MKFEEIQKFIKIAKEEGVKELNYESKGTKISVTLGLGGEQEGPRLNSSWNDDQRVEVNHNFSHPRGSETDKAEATGSQFTEVTSPIVGTFYNAPSPGSEPYVTVGDRVKKGQVLCIIEAMKIMNEIESEADGEIVEACVENENYVEYGEALFKIRPS